MRRRPGISGLQRDNAARQEYKALGQHVAESKLEVMRAQMEMLKKSLEEFAIKHKSDIRADPAFRAQFHTMCANAGVDPLSSNKGMWAQLLGFGDFYYSVGVQIIEGCIATRPYNGGIMDITTLLKFLQRRRGSAAEPVSQDDVERAIGKLKALGGGYELMSIGGKRYVRSVPGELNTDKNALIEMAQAHGFVTLPQAMAQLQWSETRAEENLWALVKEGLALIDDGSPDGTRLYWFPLVDTAPGAWKLAAPSSGFIATLE